MERMRSKCRQWFFIDYLALREALAELLGTAILIVIGNGSVAQKVLSHNSAGNPVTVYMAWGIAVTLGVYVSGGVTGGHINPAISLAMCFLGRLSWVKLPLYVLSQYAGAIFGSAIVYAVYYDAINAFDSGIRSVVGPNGTAGIFSTYPQSYLSIGGGLGDQIVGTMILACCVLAITDERNMGVRKDLIPVLVGLVVVAIGSSYGLNCGYAINPARDLGPRIFTFVAGWGTGVFSYNNYKWFWIPIVGPHIGALLGAVVYQLAIANHWPRPQQEFGEIKTIPRDGSVSTPLNTSHDIHTISITRGDVKKPLDT